MKHSLIDRDAPRLRLFAYRCTIKTLRHMSAMSFLDPRIAWKGDWNRENGMENLHFKTRMAMNEFFFMDIIYLIVRDEKLHAKTLDISPSSSLIVDLCDQGEWLAHGLNRNL